MLLENISVAFGVLYRQLFCSVDSAYMAVILPICIGAHY